MQGCQHDGDGYGMGSLSTITFNMEQSIPKENKWTLVANYSGGADGRQFNAIIEYDPSTTTPSLHYISEEPRLHYVSSTIYALSLLDLHACMHV